MILTPVNQPAVPKIAYVLKRYPRFSETFVVSEILAHEAAGLDVTIFALRPPVDSHFQNIISQVRSPVIYLLSKDLRGSRLWEILQEASQVLPDFWQQLAIAQGEDVHDLHQAILLARAALDRGITHFHAHFATSATTVARLASHFTGIPYSFTAHAKDIFHDYVRPDDLQRKLKDAATVITVSDYNVQYLRQHFSPGGPDAPEEIKNLQRIYNGLNLAQFPYAAPQQRPPLIVSVGRLVKKKGFADLIRACGLLAEQGHEFECQIIGSGDQEEALRWQIQQQQLQHRVQLLGPRPQAEVIRLVQSAAAFAAPCVVGEDGNRDGLPTVLLEAMALGTPCISTDVTGIPEVVRHQETGLLVGQHDPAALAAGLLLLLRQPNLRLQLAAQARQLIEAEFDIERNSARLRQAFGLPETLPQPKVLQEVG